MHNVDVAIIGGGLSGLSLAHYLKHEGIVVSVLEKEALPGGVMQTSFQDGYILDRGPQTFQITPEIKSLLSELNLSDAVNTPDCKNRYIGIPKTSTLYQVPLNPLELLSTKLLSIKDKVLLLREAFGTHNARKDLSDCSLYDMFSERFGERITHSVIAPAFVGIWASPVEMLSSRLVCPELFKAFVEGRSLTRTLLAQAQAQKRIRGSSPIGGFPKGFSTLISALSDSLESSLTTSYVVRRMEKTASSYIINDEIEAKRVVLACPPSALNIPELQTVPQASFAPVHILHASLPKEAMKHKGFGVLVPPGKSNSLLGIIFTSNLFPSRSPEDYFLLTCFCGGSHNIASYSEKNAIEEIKSLLSIKIEPKIVCSTFWKEGIPLYSQDHTTLSHANSSLPRNVYLHTNVYGGTSIPKIIEKSILLSNRIAQDIWKNRNSEISSRVLRAI